VKTCEAEATKLLFHRGKSLSPAIWNIIELTKIKEKTPYESPEKIKYEGNWKVGMLECWNTGILE